MRWHERLQTRTIRPHIVAVPDIVNLAGGGEPKVPPANADGQTGLHPC